MSPNYEALLLAAPLKHSPYVSQKSPTTTCCVTG